jgi:hypothetical protein
VPPEPLEYARPTADRPADRSRLPLAAFLWSLCAPAVAGGILYALGESGLDLDDRLPRAAAIAVFAAVAQGVPLLGLLAGAVAAARAVTGRDRGLAGAAVLLGAVWCVAACGLLAIAVSD